MATKKERKRFKTTKKPAANNMFFTSLLSRFSFLHFFVLVLVFVNEFVNFWFFTIFVFVFVNENHIQASSSLSAFRQCLKTLLFRQSFPDIIL